jgi:hypothetical protein
MTTQTILTFLKENNLIIGDILSSPEFYYCSSETMVKNVLFDFTFESLAIDSDVDLIELERLILKTINDNFDELIQNYNPYL